MLESLTIRNYAIIDEVTAEFSPGLNIITGETGAGKSIMVDALELVLGMRASADMIRSGADSLEVSGIFTKEETLPLDISPIEPEENVFIFRREVRSDGNNRCFINDRPVTLRTLKELGDRLVDFHGQHDHQSLLDVSEHVSFLDGYGKLMKLTDEVSELYNEMVKVRTSLNNLLSSIEQKNRDRELFTFQLGEIEEANPQPGEDESLGALLQKLSRARELKALGWQIFQELSENDGSISERLGEFATTLESMAHIDSELTPFSKRFENVISEIEDIAHSFRNYAEKTDDDPTVLAECEERLAAIEKLKKKYGPRLDDVVMYREKIRRELDTVEHAEEERTELQRKSIEIEAKLAEQSLLLSKKRHDVAPKLAREVELHLAELGMSGAHLNIDIQPIESGETVTYGGNTIFVGTRGIDYCEFMISTNPGEPSRPLVKIASGGEISRVMLSLKLALVDVNSIPTMVFDEIDVGVSGRVAEAVGKKLVKLTEARQAIVITHLPQIAVMAERHFSARKVERHGRTCAELIRLDTKMRQRELATLLSGETLTDTAMAHARELMDGVDKKKINSVNEINRME